MTRLLNQGVRSKIATESQYPAPGVVIYVPFFQIYCLFTTQPSCVFVMTLKLFAPLIGVRLHRGFNGCLCAKVEAVQNRHMQVLMFRAHKNGYN